MEKRYVAVIDLYVYAENDESAKQKAEEIAMGLDKQTDNKASVIQLVERPFGIGPCRFIFDNTVTVNNK